MKTLLMTLGLATMAYAGFIVWILAKCHCLNWVVSALATMLTLSALPLMWVALRKEAWDAPISDACNSVVCRDGSLPVDVDTQAPTQRVVLLPPPVRDDLSRRLTIQAK